MVGLPLSLDGSVGPAAAACASEVDELAEATGLPVEPWDERLTTVTADRDLIAQGLRRRRAAPGRRQGGRRGHAAGLARPPPRPLRRRGTPLMSDDTHRDEDARRRGRCRRLRLRRATATATTRTTTTRTTSSCAPPPSRGRRLLTVLLVLVLVLVVGAGVAFVWVQRQLDPPGEAGEPRPVVIAEGSTSDDIGAQLADEGIISSELAWDWYLRINGGGPFQAGEYQLGDDSSIGVRGRHAQRRPRAARGAQLHGARGADADRDARRAWPAEEVGLGFDRAALQALLDSGAGPLVGPAARSALQRGDPVPRDLPGRRRAPTRRPCCGSWSASSTR